MKPFTRNDKIAVGLLAVILVLHVGRSHVGRLAPQPTAAVYVYEKDEGTPPAAILAGLDQLNRRGLTATTFEDDSINGRGEIPRQYKSAVPAARTAGLPALVLLAGDRVLRVTKPTTETQVAELAR
jgi:hypothetical protein